MSDNNQGVVKLQVLWGVSCAGFGIVFTILFSSFVDSYSKQADTQQEILNRLTGIEAQMIMADFPTLRSDLDKVESEVKNLKTQYDREIKTLNEKIASILNQVKDLKGEKS